MSELKDRCNINLSDNDAYEFSDELLTELKRELDVFSSHAMSDHTLFLQGQKDMLRQVVDYLTAVMV